MLAWDTVAYEIRDTVTHGVKDTKVLRFKLRVLSNVNPRDEVCHRSCGVQL